MSSGKGKRKREGEGLYLQGGTVPDSELMKYAMSAPRIEILPGLWWRIVRRRRSKNDAKAWKCTCGYVNNPVRHLFFDLPRFKCASSECNNIIPDDYEFEFSLGDIEANGACPLGFVKEQNSPHCMVYAAATSAEVTTCITRILLGQEIKDKGPEICIQTFLEKLRQEIGLRWNADMNEYGNLGVNDLWRILEILNTMDGSGEVCKISDFSEVSFDFKAVCKELAGGYPLLTVIRTGKRFDDLKYNEIYEPPKKSRIVPGKSHGLHCITLIGAGMRKGRKFYRFVNTHGEEFCPLANLERKDGIKGGFGYVTAEGLAKCPVKLHREGQGIGHRKGKPVIRKKVSSVLER